MSDANGVRGELELELPETTYLLRPEHGRAVKLDDALPLGILGTLLQMTSDDQVLKLRTMATIVHYLADGRPKTDDVIKQMARSNYMNVAAVVIEALRRVAGGQDDGDKDAGEADALSSQATG